MGVNYRVDHMIGKSKENLILADQLNKQGVFCMQQVINAVSALTGAVEALAIATGNEALRYDQFNHRVIKES